VGHGKRKLDIPVWLEVTGIILAVLAFVGVATFDQIGPFMDGRKPDPTPPAATSPTPPVPQLPQDTGPNDPQDAGTCTSALSDIHALESDVPTYSYSAMSQFYGDESTTFSSLSDAATNLYLNGYLAMVANVTASLEIDYMHETLNDPADDNSVSHLAELRADVSKIRSFCSQEAGITG
jgi:hypothetical protein